MHATRRAADDPRRSLTGHLRMARWRTGRPAWGRHVRAVLGIVVAGGVDDREHRESERCQQADRPAPRRSRIRPSWGATATPVRTPSAATPTASAGDWLSSTSENSCPPGRPDMATSDRTAGEPDSVNTPASSRQTDPHGSVCRHRAVQPRRPSVLESDRAQAPGGERLPGPRVQGRDRHRRRSARRRRPRCRRRLSPRPLRPALRTPVPRGAARRPGCCSALPARTSATVTERDAEMQAARRSRSRPRPASSQRYLPAGRSQVVRLHDSRQRDDLENEERSQGEAAGGDAQHAGAERVSRSRRRGRKQADHRQQVPALDELPATGDEHAVLGDVQDDEQRQQDEREEAQQRQMPPVGPDGRR